MTARSGLVPALGTVRRLRALVALGWPPAVLRVRSGLVVELLLWSETALVTVEAAAVTGALFERLSGTPGPDPVVRVVAAGLEWLTPHAWDDDELDDPQAQGSRGVHITRRAA